MKKLDQKGFHLVPIVVGVVVIAGIGFAGWRVLSKDKSGKTENNTSQSSGSSQTSAGSDVTWQWNGDRWEASDTAPTCSEPMAFASPVDISKATSTLYPGQQRSTGYKTHGGFLFYGSDNDDITVTIPIDSHLIKASRYIEQGDVQYFMVFTTPCGFAYRFDHLLTLSPKFQAIIDKLPEAKVDDSRTTPMEPPIAFKKGEVVATAVGFVTKKNVSTDFGVYDIRQPNAASKDSAYASRHADEKEFAYYGVCWFDLLPSADATIVKALPAGDGASGKSSDYCK